MSLEEQIKLNCGNVPHDRFKISGLEDINTATVLRGAVFVFATWSSQAIVSFRVLCEALGDVRDARFPIWVLDADGFDLGAFESAFGELPQGRGETYWIRDGQIAYRDHGYTTETKRMVIGRVLEFASVIQ